MSILTCDSLSKSYGEKQVLADVSFTVEPGDIVGLLGKNGAGKTTILNCITGIIQPDGGDVRFKGTSLLPENPLRSEFGVLLTPVFCDYLNVEQNLTLLARSSNGRIPPAEIPDRIDQVLELVDLKNTKHQKVKKLSFGMRQRLGLAQTLLDNVSFLLLDEPLVGLDPIGKDIVKDVLRLVSQSRDKAILFSSHDLPDVAEVCNRIIMIRDGTVVFDGPNTSARRTVINLTYPLPRLMAPVPGVTVNGTELSFMDDTIINELIAYGIFDTNPILSIHTEDDSIIRLFDEN